MNGSLMGTVSIFDYSFIEIPLQDKSADRAAGGARDKKSVRSLFLDPNWVWTKLHWCLVVDLHLLRLPTR